MIAIHEHSHSASFSGIDMFTNYRLAPSISCPAMVIHGDIDEVKEVDSIAVNNRLTNKTGGSILAWSRLVSVS